MLFGDSTDRERSGLGRRKLVRLLAPQTSESPLFMHLTDASPKGVKAAGYFIAVLSNLGDLHGNASYFLAFQ